MGLKTELGFFFLLAVVVLALVGWSHTDSAQRVAVEAMPQFIGRQATPYLPAAAPLRLPGDPRRLTPALVRSGPLQ